MRRKRRIKSRRKRKRRGDKEDLEEEEKKNMSRRNGGWVSGRRASGRGLFPWTDGHLSVPTITLSGSELLRRSGRFVFLFTVLKYES